MTKRYLGLDWGEKNIGLALGIKDADITPIVVPLKTIATAVWERAIFEIAKEVKENKIDVIVLGNPLDLKGQETQGSLKVKRFKGFLERRLKIEVILFNEFYTTQDSLKDIFVEGKEGYDSHSLAATLILQQYFEAYENDKPHRNKENK